MSRHQTQIGSVVPGLALAALLLLPAHVSRAADAEAAKILARQSNCFKCHSVEKKKDGPAWKDVAAKFKDKDKADAEARLFTHLTTGEKVKFEDGHEEEHAIVKTKDKAQIDNLIAWILSLQ